MLQFDSAERDERSKWLGTKRWSQQKCSHTCTRPIPDHKPQSKKLAFLLVSGIPTRDARGNKPILQSRESKQWEEISSMRMGIRRLQTPMEFKEHLSGLRCKYSTPYRYRKGVNHPTATALAFMKDRYA